MADSGDCFKERQPRLEGPLSMNCLRGALHVGDSLLCCLLFFPAMVLYWRGIWDLWGYYLPGGTPLNSWIMFGVGSCSFLGYFVVPLLDRHLPRRPRVLYIMVSRLYLYVIAALLMCLWRGAWELPDYYLGQELPNNLIIFMLSYLFLLLSRSGRTAIFPPMFSARDTRGSLLQAATRFGTKPYSVPYALDALCSHCLLLVTILCWRCMLNLILYLVWTDPLQRDLGCLVVGSAAVTSIYLLEELLAALALKFEEFGGWRARLVWEDTVYFVVLWALGFLWLGSWNLVATYCLPSVPEGAWVCHGVGTVVLMATQQFSYVSCCGCAVDGADQGRDAIFPTHFLRHYLLNSGKKTKDYDMSQDSSESQGRDNPVFTITDSDSIEGISIRSNSVDLGYCTGLELGQSAGADPDARGELVLGAHAGIDFVHHNPDIGFHHPQNTKYWSLNRNNFENFASRL